MENNITLTIETRHFKAASAYYRPQGCPLYCALKEMFPEKVISVGPYAVMIVESPQKYVDTHEISRNWAHDIETVNINKWIKEAKQDQEIEPIEIVLSAI